MNIKYAFDEILKLIKFFRPSFAGKLITAGVLLFLGVWGYNGNIIFEHVGDINHLKLDFSSSEIPELISYLVTLLAFVMIFIGCSIGVYDWAATHRRNARLKNIVIEMRGLDGSVNTPLQDKIADAYPGQVDEVLIDIRSHVSAQTKAELERALEKVNNARSRVETAVAGKAREDIVIHAGMIAPVPFQFLLGAILDDEFIPKIWEYERFRKEWQPLDNNDATLQIIDNLDQVKLGKATEVVLALSATYQISDEPLANSWSKLKIVRITVPNATPNKIWTENDQILIVEAFVDLMAKLHNRGIKRVHLALAASPSISLRLGSHYDQRNFPEITVYQYNPNQKRYTWGVNLPIDEYHSSKVGKLVNI